MTRKHFVAIAEILAHCSCDDTTVETFADYLATQNHNFNRSMFLGYIEDLRDQMDYNV